jgi:cell division protein FtsB
MLTSFFGRVLFLISAIIFCVLQSLLWLGDGGILDTYQIKEEVLRQKAHNEKLAERNRILQAEVDDLKSGTESIEGHARLDLGMIQEGETFFLVTATKKPLSEASE